MTIHVVDVKDQVLLTVLIALLVPIFKEILKFVVDATRAIRNTLIMVTVGTVMQVVCSAIMVDLVIAQNVILIYTSIKGCVSLV